MSLMECAISVKNCTPCWRWSSLCLTACSPVNTVKARSSPCWICWMSWCHLPLRHCRGSFRCLRSRFVWLCLRPCRLLDDLMPSKSKPRASWARRRSLCWRGHGCVGPCLVQRASTCCKAFTLLGEQSPLTFWLPGIKPSAPVVLWKIGIALSGLIWRLIANSRLVCSPCSPFGIITGLLLVVLMRVFLPYNGRNLPRPLTIGWLLWAMLLSLPDCSKVSHGFEPCLRVQSVHGVAARSVFLGAPSVDGKALALLHPRSRSLADSERYSLSGGGSHRLPSYSLAGGAKHLVLSRSTRSFLGQTHSREGQSPHRSTTCSFPLPRARATASLSQGVAAERRYLHDHDLLWRPGRTVQSPGSQSTAQGSMCHHCRWCAVVGQWQHQEQARDGSSYSLKLLAPFKRHSYHDRCNIIRPTVLVCPFHQAIHTLLRPKSLYNLLQLFIAHKIREAIGAKHEQIALLHRFGEQVYFDVGLLPKTPVDQIALRVPTSLIWSEQSCAYLFRNHRMIL